jgi:hypothetical protein
MQTGRTARMGATVLALVHARSSLPFDRPPPPIRVGTSHAPPSAGLPSSFELAGPTLWRMCRPCGKDLTRRIRRMDIISDKLGICTSSIHVTSSSC